jgi:hypothetical protein
MKQKGFGLLLAFGIICAAHAEVTEQEAIQAQLGSALAAVDYALKNCPKITVNQARIDELALRAGKTATKLREGEDYAEQREVQEMVERQQGKAMVCAILPTSQRGGYKRGILN